MYISVCMMSCKHDAMICRRARRVHIWLDVQNASIYHLASHWAHHSRPPNSQQLPRRWVLHQHTYHSRTGHMHEYFGSSCYMESFSRTQSIVTAPELMFPPNTFSAPLPLHKVHRSNSVASKRHTPEIQKPSYNWNSSVALLDRICMRDMR